MPMCPKLLETLREYWRWKKPRTWLFPGEPRGASEHLTDKSVGYACAEAARHAGLKKRVSPHMLRRSLATHLLEDSADLPTIQVLLGHADLEATSIYLHLSRRHLLWAQRAPLSARFPPASDTNIAVVLCFIAGCLTER